MAAEGKTEAAPLKLSYFPGRGRAGASRIVLAELGEPWENELYSREAFGKAKAAGAAGPLTFGSLPLLDDGDFHLSNSPAILVYLARKAGLMPTDAKNEARALQMIDAAESLRIMWFKAPITKEGEPAKKAFLEDVVAGRFGPAFEALLAGGNDYLCGDKFSVGDIAVFDAMDMVLGTIPDAFAAYPNVTKFVTRIGERPAIVALKASDKWI